MLHDRKNALVATSMLNAWALPFVEQQKISLLRILTNRGTENCCQTELHEYGCTRRSKTSITADHGPASADQRHAIFNLA